MIQIKQIKTRFDH